jgi:type II secretory pathway predicted ATPase ExeA
VLSFQTQDDTLTYERHFGLNEKPFSLNADPRFVYHSPAYAETFAALLAGIRRREGLLVLTGEIGTGKTTLCRAVIRDLGRKTYSSLVPDPFASREDLLKMLLVDFGVVASRDLAAGPLRGASRTELSYMLSEFLDKLSPESFVLVVIDEAQNLSMPLIEETRILSDTFGARGRLQFVFVGQPELHGKLKLPEMRQVDQRVCGYHRLEPLTRDAAAGYIQHRLQTAGADYDRQLFPPAVVDAIHRRSGGVPRLINRVCDRALQLAFERRAEGVDQETLDAALAQVGSTTLLPTWDSIVSAPPVSAPAPAAQVPAPSAATVAPAIASLPPIDHDQEFKSEIADWFEHELEPPSRTPSLAADEDTRASRRGRTTEGSRESAYTVTTEWPRDLRSETYIQKLIRLWAKRAAMAVGLFIAFNVAIAGVSLLVGPASAPELPGVPEAPAAAAVPAIAPLETPVADTTPTLESAPPLEPVSVAAAEFLVAVGLFSSTERADQLVDTLTNAGLPAMQRAFQLRQRPMQQIVLGPFPSRSDALADLRRLQALGGYDDARVISEP